MIISWNVSNGFVPGNHTCDRKLWIQVLLQSSKDRNPICHFNAMCSAVGNDISYIRCQTSSLFILCGECNRYPNVMLERSEDVISPLSLAPFPKCVPQSILLEDNVDYLCIYCPRELLCTNCEPSFQQWPKSILHFHFRMSQYKLQFIKCFVTLIFIK